MRRACLGLVLSALLSCGGGGGGGAQVGFTGTWSGILSITKDTCGEASTTLDEEHHVNLAGNEVILEVEGVTYRGTYSSNQREFTASREVVGPCFDDSGVVSGVTSVSVQTYHYREIENGSARVTFSQNFEPCTGFSAEFECGRNWFGVLDQTSSDS